MPKDKCELLEHCGFFKNYCKDMMVKAGFVAMFCNDKMKSEECARKQSLRKHGHPPADNMSPTGELL